MNYVVLTKKPDDWDVEQYSNKEDAEEKAAFVQKFIDKGNVTTITEVLVAPVSKVAALLKGSLNA